MQGSSRAVVQEWHAAEGWGVLTSAETPGGCWIHFSAVDVDGCPSLEVGQEVDLVAEAADQDGYAWRAVRVRIDGEPTATRQPDASGSAYRSGLRIVWDDEG